MNREKTIIIGAGGAGEELLEELIQKDKFYNYNIIGFIDDDDKKKNRFIHGKKIIGGLNQIPAIIKKENITTVLIAIPSSSGELIRRIYSICSRFSVKIKLIPRLSEIINGSVNFDHIKDISVEDLLGRSAINQDFENAHEEMNNKTVLVSGAAGSIGSELCKQCLFLAPRKIICVDQWENGIFYLQKNLENVVQTCNFEVKTEIKYQIGDIRDKEKINYIFNKFKPNIVFNAAAYKHVPLMESNIDQAILNNINGTKNLCEATINENVEKFVLISTDKAVNPTNVMGATKRITEKLMHYYSSKSTKTKFSAVRFGNVLNSNGSVIPTFQEQIKKGTLTITHKDIIRYFMTITEAAQLVLQCWSQSNGNEIFILDMGEPIKILDLAKLMIRLRGFEPYKDIDIKIVGLRPGEKLYEELLTDVEQVNTTTNKKISIVSKEEEFDHVEFFDKVKEIIKDCKKQNIVKLKERLKELVPTYVELNSKEYCKK
ncbi:polysaccharide biosynthesis protein [Bacteroidota bacterium]